MGSVSQNDQFSTLPPGPSGPQAVPISSLPPGPSGPQAVPVAALPPGPSAPQAVPVAVQYSSSHQSNQQHPVAVQQQTQFQHRQNISSTQQTYQSVSSQSNRNGPMQPQYLIHQEQQQPQASQQQTQHLQYQIVVQQSGQDQHQQAYPATPQQPQVAQQPHSSSQSYETQQQYIQVQQQQPSVVQIPPQGPPRQLVSQYQYQYQIQENQSLQQAHTQQQHSQQPQQQQHTQQNPQQQFVVMQVQQHPQQQQVVSYQYQQSPGLQQSQQTPQSQHRYVIQNQQSGIQGSSPATPQRFYIKSQHQGSPQRQILPTVQGSNQPQQQFSTPTNISAQNQSTQRQQWQPQQPTIRGQIMQPHQGPVQRGIPPKRTIMIQSHSPMPSNVIRLQTNSNLQRTVQPRMMQIRQSNSGNVMQTTDHPVNNSSQQQYPNLRMTNGVQAAPHVIRATGMPRIAGQVNLRQMPPHPSQGQYQQQSGMNQQPRNVQTQQALPNQRLQNPTNPQWENRPNAPFQTGQQPQNLRLATPQQQTFVMQTRPTGQPLTRPLQVVSQRKNTPYP